MFKNVSTLTYIKVFNNTHKIKLWKTVEFDYFPEVKWRWINIEKLK